MKRNIGVFLQLPTSRKVTVTSRLCICMPRRYKFEQEWRGLRLWSKASFIFRCPIHMQSRTIWIGKLGTEEVRSGTTHSLQDMGMASDAENQLDRMENQNMDSGEGIGIPEEKGILEQIKHRKLSKYCHWKRRSDSVVLATIRVR